MSDRVAFYFDGEPWDDAVDKLHGLVVTLAFDDGRTRDVMIVGSGNDEDDGWQGITFRPWNEEAGEPDTFQMFARSDQITSVTVL